MVTLAPDDLHSVVGPKTIQSIKLGNLLTIPSFSRHGYNYSKISIEQPFNRVSITEMREEPYNEPSQAIPPGPQKDKLWVKAQEEWGRTTQ